ncbi:MAG: YraN family protein [Candidatus Gracilibacteria bacterium]|nr:YraN family protein [Candidatus Gracilibacteria bacterium]
MTTKQTGDKGEVIAIKYLQKNGYNILDSNFKFGRFGELDLIAKKDDLTIFFEVKYRNNDSYGIPEESIIPNKLRKCKKTIEYYVVKNRLDFEQIRFDVITIMKGDTSYKVKHYKNVQI